MIPRNCISQRLISFNTDYPTHRIIVSLARQRQMTVSKFVQEAIERSIQQILETQWAGATPAQMLHYFEGQPRIHWLNPQPKPRACTVNIDTLTYRVIVVLATLEKMSVSWFVDRALQQAVALSHHHSA